jgi:hypothetical protein
MRSGISGRIISSCIEEVHTLYSLSISQGSDDELRRCTVAFKDKTITTEKTCSVQQVVVITCND